MNSGFTQLHTISVRIYKSFYKSGHGTVAVLLPGFAISFATVPWPDTY